MTSHSRIQTTKQKKRDRIYRDALGGNVFAMKTLRDVYGYVQIKVKGKLVKLEEI